MDEKTLIKSEIDKKARRCFKAIIYGGAIIAATLCIVLLLIRVDSYSGTHTAIYAGFAWSFLYPQYLVTFIIACSMLLISLITLLFYVGLSRCELLITEKNVTGKTLFGKQVVLPIYMISSYSIRRFLSAVIISTASGVTKFALIGNYAEIGNVLSQKINERQENTAHQTTVSTPVPQPSAMDELKKLKDLFDAGIITQEEFDAKKKQLLGL